MLCPAPVTPAQAIESADAELSPLSDRLWAAVPDDELIDAVTALEQHESRLAALRARLLTEVAAREIPRKQLSWASTGDWFAHLAGLTRSAGHRAVTQAALLTSAREATLEALADGRISGVQAGVICDAVDKLPTSPSLRVDAEERLLAEAGHLDATQLTVAGRQVVALVDPDRAERKAEAELAREERAAHLGRGLSIVDDGAGGVRVRGRGSVEDGAVLRAALLPLTKPAPAVDPDDPSATAGSDPRDHGTRLWDGLVVLAQHSLDTDLQPESHGARPRVSVLIDWESLRGDVDGTGPEATTDDGLRLSHAAVRRLACDADVLPICLGTDGEVLDVGRRHRLVTMALWLALIARDRHCAFPGCTRPPVMCHGHHIQHWADGGPTRLDNLVMLCGAHHRVIHDTAWQVRISTADGRPEFLPPPRRRGDPPPDEWTRHRPRRE